jgi:hypothetical protein
MERHVEGAAGADRKYGVLFTICRAAPVDCYSEPILCIQVILPARFLMLQPHKIIQIADTTYTSERLADFPAVF